MPVAIEFKCENNTFHDFSPNSHVIRVVRVVSRVVHAKRGFFFDKIMPFFRIFEKKSSPLAVPCGFDRLPKNRESREI